MALAFAPLLRLFCYAPFLFLETRIEPFVLVAQGGLALLGIVPGLFGVVLCLAGSSEICLQGTLLFLEGFKALRQALLPAGMGLFGRLAFLALLIEQSHQARLGGFIAFFLLRQTLTVRLGLFLQCLSMSLFAASCFLLGRFQAPHQLIETIPRSGFPFLKGLVLGAQLSQFRGALLETLIDLGQVC